MKVKFPLRKPPLLIRPKLSKPSRKQFVLLLAAVFLITIIGYNGYQRLFAPSAATPSIQTVPARIGPLVSTLSATGSIVATRQAKLSFPTTGKLMELNVAVGDAVKAGQQLAKQDDSTLKLKVQTAETNLRVSQIKLQQLKDGATPEEKEAAKASYESALARYNELVAGPTETEIQSARASVDQAKANLAVAQVKLEQAKAGVSLNEQTLLSEYDQAKAALMAAEDKLEKLKNPTASDLASAQAAVETARASLKSAQTALDELKNPTQSALAAAQSAVNSAKQAMTTALDRYEMAKGDNLGESGFTSVTAAQQNYESAKANYEAKLQDLNKLLNPSPEDLQEAQAKLDSAQNNYDSAVAKLEQLKNPTATDLASAEAAV
ncbi:MAG: biotin/lipoyl-binding protein, partial [Chloroflexota bacterium]